MGESDWDRLQRLFHRALALQPWRRAAYLEESCGGDTMLRARLDKMLAAADSEGQLFDALDRSTRRKRPRSGRA